MSAAQLQELGYLHFSRQPQLVNFLTKTDRFVKKFTKPESPKRHGGTWFVGVDALPNDAQGCLEGACLKGPWQDLVPDLPLHRAQLSITFPGYPLRDAQESEAAHRYRRNRFGAHVDGLLPIGHEKRRYVKEPHAYILGVGLSDVRAAPLMIWPRSHHIMGPALQEAIRDKELSDTDVTDFYKAARKRVFETIEPMPLPALRGEAVLLHRHMLHGIAPWETAEKGHRAMLYLRPQFENASLWLFDQS